MAQGNPNPVNKFKKGDIGNPRGRPKLLKDIQALARKRTKRNLEKLGYWADQTEDGNIAVRALIALHEIAWGKPTQAVTAESTGQVTFQISWLPPQLPTTEKPALPA